MRIKISVVIPVYNSAEYIEDCLNSILNQDVGEIEVICTDDGSTDESLSILENYAKSDSRVIVLHQDKQGASAARNNSLKRATGEYLHFVDSDDVLASNVYNSLYEAAKDDNLDLIYFEADTIFENEQLETEFSNRREAYIKKNSYSGIYNGIDFFCEMNKNVEYSPVPWLFLVKKELIIKNQICFFEDIPVHNDNPFSFLVITKAQRVGLYQHCCYHRRIRQNSLSTTPRGYTNFIGYALSLYYIYQSLCSYAISDEQEEVITNYLEEYILKNVVNDFKVLDTHDKEIIEELPIGATKKMFIDDFVLPYIFQRTHNDKSAELKRIKRSLSYRIGYSLTYVPRRVRALYKEFAQEKTL